jgi:hypothetical protein
MTTEDTKDWRDDEIFSFLRPGETSATAVMSEATSPSQTNGVVINEFGIPIGPDGKVIFVDGPRSGGMVALIVVAIVLLFGVMVVGAVSHLSKQVRLQFNAVNSSSVAEKFVTDLRDNRVDEVWTRAPEAFRQVRTKDGLSYFAQTLQSFPGVPLTYESAEPGSYPSDRIVSLSLSDATRALVIMVTLRPGANGAEEAIQFNTAMLTPGELASIRATAGIQSRTLG